MFYLKPKLVTSTNQSIKTLQPNGQKWIEDKIELPKLFINKTTNTTRIEDFRIKFLMNYWSKNKFKCELCNGEFSSWHILRECEGIKTLEVQTYGLFTRELRLNSHFNYKSTNYDLSWILNWCIWKNYLKLIFDKEKVNKENLRFLLKSEIKRNELLYLKIMEKKLHYKSFKKQLEMIERTTHFLFFKIVQNQSRNQILPIENYSPIQDLSGIYRSKFSRKQLISILLQ